MPGKPADSSGLTGSQNSVSPVAPLSPSGGSQLRYRISPGL